MNLMDINEITLKYNNKKVIFNRTGDTMLVVSVYTNDDGTIMILLSHQVSLEEKSPKYNSFDIKTFKENFSLL